MFPGFTLNDPIRCSAVDPKASSDCRNRAVDWSIQPSHLPHIISSNFAFPVILPALKIFWTMACGMIVAAQAFLWMSARTALISGCVSSFYRTIPAVVSQCTKEQVVRIDAKPVVAAVKNTQGKWVYSVIKYVREAMGGGCSFGKTYSAISAASDAPKPYPAAWRVIGSFGVLPKSINCLLRYCGQWFRLIEWHVDLLERSMCFGSWPEIALRPGQFVKSIMSV